MQNIFETFVSLLCFITEFTSPVWEQNMEILFKNMFKYSNKCVLAVNKTWSANIWLEE